MHGYTQTLVKRMLGKGGRAKKWSISDLERIAGRIYEEAPACGCGCGNKTFPHAFKSTPASLNNIRDGLFCEFITGHHQTQFDYKYTPNDDQHQIVISSMIGDGCMIRAHSKGNHRLAWNMGSEDHARFKMSMLEWAKPTLKIGRNPGFGKMWFSLKTSCHPIFTEYAKKYGDSVSGYKAGLISSELNETGWAWYYGDDGHLDKKGGVAYIHTEGYSIDNIEEIIKSLSSFINMPGVKIHRYVGGVNKKEFFCIRLLKNETKEFCERVKKHMASGMEYKII